MGGVGVLALSLIVWFAGDAVAFSDWRPLETTFSRTLTVVIIVLAWLGYEGIRILLERRRNRSLLEGMAGGADDDDSGAKSSADVAQVRETFERSIATLKKARFKGEEGGQAYLYQMPWYVFIGAPGSGKTTALRNSGLKFPLAADDGTLEIKGVGGTRNCDWFFTDEAVLLDTAGRFMTQESDQKADRAGWLGFLGLLKKFRPRQPLNGALVTVSVSDLLAWDEAARAKYAATVRLRVAELYEQLGIRFPIYVLVTKTDLLAGFMEFFSDLGREEREQVWGVTFPYSATGVEGVNVSEAFAGEFKQLESRVLARVTDRLQQERDLQRRALIYNLPQQFSLIGPLVTAFLDGVFRASRFDQQPMLRGVYFSSGTQEGTPIDRVLGALARNFNLERKVLPPSTATGKSFFLTRVLSEVVFPEAGLVGANERREKALKWVARGAYAAICLLAVGSITGWVFSYFENRALIADVEQKVLSIQQKVAKLPPPKADDVFDVVPLLNELRDLPFGSAESTRQAPWTMRLGLFQGEKIGVQANNAYQRVLREAFLPRIGLRLEDQFRTPANSEVLYEALKAYLMLYLDKQLDPAALEAWVDADWERRLPREGGAGLRKDLAGHLRAAVERRPVDMVLPMDKQLVATARKTLANALLPDRIYARLKALGVGSSATPFKISDVAGQSASQVFVRGSGTSLSAPFPGLFTYEGYSKSFKSESEKLARQFANEEAWILGEQQAGAQKVVATVQLIEEVRSRYLADYVKEWEGLLSDIQLRKPASRADTLLFARVLAAADSPLKKLAVAASRETTLIRADDVKGALAGKAQETVVDATKKMLSKILGDSSAAQVVGDKAKRPESQVDDRFQKLRDLVTPGGPNQAAPIDSLMTLLNDFYLELSNLNSQVSGGAMALQTLATAKRLQAEAERMPAPLQGVLRSLVEATSGQAAAHNTAELAGAIGGSSAFCRKAIAGRYPVTKTAQNEIAVEDFNKVFSPGGDLDDFFAKSLAPLVDTSGQTWRPRAGTETTLPVSPGAIVQFQNAATIRDAFFRGGSRVASAQAELTLAASDAPQVNLEYDGQVQKLAVGATVRLIWPSQRPGPSAKLFGADGGQKVSGDGPWALFRLFDKATIDPAVTGDRVRFNFTVDGKRMSLDLRASSIYNPFRLRALESFQCPGGR